MAAIKGYDAAEFAQVVDGPDASTHFDVGTTGDNYASTPRGKLRFTDLSNADTIVYKAVSLDDPAKWEVGVGTYDSTDEQLDRADADVMVSSNSDARVDFKKSDGSGAAVFLEGLALVGDTAITDLTDNSGGTAADTIAAISASYDQSEVANAVASLAAKINAVKQELEAVNAIRS